jgi:hypothetical protein
VRRFDAAFFLSQLGVRRFDAAFFSFFLSFSPSPGSFVSKEKKESGVKTAALQNGHSPKSPSIRRQLL